MAGSLLHGTAPLSGNPSIFTADGSLLDQLYFKNLYLTHYVLSANNIKPQGTTSYFEPLGTNNRLRNECPH